MVSFLTDLMISDQHWGSVVEDTKGEVPICFGSCIFISDQLAEGLLNGDYPFLLADLCQKKMLRSHILSYDEIEKQSKLYKLNFYGGLFTFARTMNPPKFGAAMNHLQRTLVNSISGFGLHWYFKQCYGAGYVHSQFTSAAMRLRFGAKLLARYANSKNLEVKQNRPLLFGLTRDDAFRVPHKLISELMCQGDPILNLPRAVRMLLRLEIEGYSHDAVGQALLQGDHDSNWTTALRAVRRNAEVFEFLGMNEEEAILRECVRDYVRQNPQELGVLPLLTPQEKNCWKTYNHLDMVASPNQKARQDTVRSR